jgi:hypothetical protein
MTKRPEHRIAAFIAKHQVDGEQNWWAKWISFRAVAEYCAKLRTSRSAVAGDAGVRFAYAELVNAIDAGEFDVGGQSRVLLLVSHGGKILSIKPSELLEAQEAFEPEIFRAGYMEQCWAPRELIARWFAKRGIPPPWAQQTKGTLRVGRGRPVGTADHARDVALIDLVLKIKAEERISDRAAVSAAISKIKRGASDTSGSVAAGLRAKLRKRRRLRQRNKII